MRVSDPVQCAVRKMWNRDGLDASAVAGPVNGGYGVGFGVLKLLALALVLVRGVLDTDKGDRRRASTSSRGSKRETT